MAADAGSSHLGKIGPQRHSVTMSHFRLCYRDPNQRFKVVIMEAPSMIHARLKAALAARDGSMIFTEELKREIAR
jgi:hypothetical protein